MSSVSYSIWYATDRYSASLDTSGHVLVGFIDTRQVRSLVNEREDTAVVYAAAKERSRAIVIVIDYFIVGTLYS